MTDGHTKKGAYKVTLELTGDMVKQLKRLAEMGKMVKEPRIVVEGHPETMDIIAYRAFLQDILDKLIEALEQPGRSPKAHSKE